MFLVDSENYMSQVKEALGASCTVGYFEDADLTSEFDYYAENVEDGFEGLPDEALPPTPEINNSYVGSNVLLPRGNNMVQGRVRKCAETTIVILLGEQMKNLSSIAGNMLLDLKTKRKHN